MTAYAKKTLSIKGNPLPPEGWTSRCRPEYEVHLGEIYYSDGIVDDAETEGYQRINTAGSKPETTYRANRSSVDPSMVPILRYELSVIVFAC